MWSWQAFLGQGIELMHCQFYILLIKINFKANLEYERGKQTRSPCTQQWWSSLGTIYHMQEFKALVMWCLFLIIVSRMKNDLVTGKQSLLNYNVCVCVCVCVNIYTHMYVYVYVYLCINQYWHLPALYTWNYNTKTINPRREEGRREWNIFRWSKGY